MLNCCLTTIAMAFCCSVFSQGGLPAGARSMSLANASVTLEDAWSYYHNPGALAGLKQTSIGISYENRYLLKELQTQTITFAHPLKTGVIAFGARTYGYKLYRATRIGAGYSLKLGERLSAGIQLNYQGLRIEGYGSRGTVTAETGLTAKINDKIILGFSISNLNRARVSNALDERFSTCMRLGMQYRISTKVLVLLEAEKEVRSRLRMKGALEYEAIDHFFLRAGGASNPVEITFGFGYRFKNDLGIDIGSAWLQRVGWSPHVGLTYDFK